MQVRLRLKRSTLKLAGIIKTEYKAYFMAFLEIFFLRVKISLIFDHEPTKHWQVVPRQKAEKGTLINLGLCKQCIFHYAQTSVEVVNRYRLLNMCSLGPHTNCDHEKVLLDANKVVLSGQNKICRPPAGRVSLLKPFHYIPQFIPARLYLLMWYGIFLCKNVTKFLWQKSKG